MLDTLDGLEGTSGKEGEDEKCGRHECHQSAGNEKVSRGMEQVEEDCVSANQVLEIQAMGFRWWAIRPELK